MGKAYAALAALAAITGPANADVTYSFVETSYSEVYPNPYSYLGDPQAQLSITTTDTAAATGFSFSQATPFEWEQAGGGQETPLDLTGSGIVQIAFTADGAYSYQTGANYDIDGKLGFSSDQCQYSAYFGATMCADNPGWYVNLSGGPNGISGQIIYLGLNDDFTWNLSGTSVTGTFVGDGGAGACGESFTQCAFAGYLDPAGDPVPEPWSLPLLGAGLFGLIIARRGAKLL